MINHPNQFQQSYVPTERGRVDLIQVQPSYALNRDDALMYNQIILTSNSPMENALAILESMIVWSKANTIFVCCNTKQLEDAYEVLKDTTRLDCRFSTIGYNAQGIVVYK